MIVRLMGEGQYRIEESLLGDLNELDERAVAALEAGNEVELDARLDDMWRLVRERGERLPDEDLSASDLIVPPSDLSLEETRALVGEHGLDPRPARLGRACRSRSSRPGSGAGRPSIRNGVPARAGSRRSPATTSRRTTRRWSLDPQLPAGEDESRFWSHLDEDVARRGRPVVVLLTTPYHRAERGRRGGALRRAARRRPPPGPRAPGRCAGAGAVRRRLAALAPVAATRSPSATR